MSRAIRALRTSRRWQAATAGGCAAAVLAVAAAVYRPVGGAVRPSGVSASVTRGPLPVTVCENGEVEADRRKVISNELSWPVIILDVVAEGTVVKEGQVIAQFECKELMEAIERQELDVTSSLAKYTQSTENLKLRKEEVANKVLKATRAKDDALAERDVYKLHDYTIELNNKQNAVNMAEQNLALARDKLDFKVRVNQMPDLESPFSENDIKADQLEVQRLENTLNQANLELDKLMRFEHERKLGDLDEKVDDGELDMKRADLEAKNQTLIAETEEQANKRTYEMQKKKLDDLRENEKKLTVTAERSGLVVYDTGRNPWDPTRVAIAKGEKIQPRQQIMVIPDMSSLQVKTKVYEAIVEQVKPGIAAFIRPDAKPGAVFTGTVDKVAPLPDSQNSWLNPGVKVYVVVVKFDKIDDSFKPGMTAEVEIILAQLEDVLSVPIAAVFTEQGKTVCYRSSNGRTQKVEVEVGMMNDRRVEVKAGLAQGDEVLLARPSQADRAGSPATKAVSSQPTTAESPVRGERARP